ncbi:MAG: hypothetical protein M3R36_17530 [Bacteroidota bacterium]|nr:hypothetical protein [Bacteroidota bacterium]
MIRRMGSMIISPLPAGFLQNKENQFSKTDDYRKINQRNPERMTLL